MKKYKAAILDDDRNLRELLVECLRFTGFEAEGYEEAEQLLRDISVANFSPRALPDLIVVDLRLLPLKMQGLEFISELVARDVPSEVMAMTGEYPGDSDLIEAIRLGAGAIVSKPFDDILSLLKKMEHLAEIGMKRRLRLKKDSRTRRRQPVFLSYSDDDARLATGLRRNIETTGAGVWHAPSSLKGGDEWRRHVEAGIDQACVFIALLTDDYVRSPACLGELLRFRRRMEASPKPRPLLLPVLAGLSDEVRRNHSIRPVLDRYQCIDLSIRFLDGLTSLLGRIEFHILKARRVKRKNGARAEPDKNNDRPGGDQDTPADQGARAGRASRAGIKRAGRRRR